MRKKPTRFYHGYLEAMTVDNSLEIRIDSRSYNEENVSRYVETIRSLVGDVDLTIGPGELVVPESCSSRHSSECQPIKGGVRFDADDTRAGTIGFKASYNGKTGFVTAGHNFIDDNGNDLAGTTIHQHPSSWWDIGNLENKSIEFGEETWCDCAFVSELSTTRSMDDGVYGMSDPSSTENAYWNQLVKISGGYTGISYGFVTSTDSDFWYDLDEDGIGETKVNDAIRASYSSRSGDSGSPIISFGGKLVGIHVGGNGHFMEHSAVTNTFPGLTWGF